MKRPAYYIKYEPETFTLILCINEWILPMLRDMAYDNRQKGRMAEGEADRPSFEHDLNADFGFGGCLSNRGIKNGFLELAFAIPEARYTDEPCFDCGGTGKMKWHEENPCWFCKGKKRNIDYGKERRHDICLTLHILFLYMESVLGNIGDLFGQQAVLVTCVGGYGHMGVGGGLSKDFCDALRSFYVKLLSDEKDWKEGQRMPSFCFDKAEDAMAKLWCRMSLTADEARMRHENRALLNEGGMFYIECPGENGCSLSVSRSIPYHFMDGKSMGEHNVDSQMQQLTLIIGFAMVYEEIIQYMQKKSG